MAEFTYQDYLTYQKYLEEIKQDANKDKYYRMKSERKIAESITQSVQLREDEYTYDDDFSSETVMEETVEYEIGKSKKEISRINHQEHDKLFRDLLNDKQEFSVFIKNFIDSSIDITPNNIEKYNRSFITSDYKARTSDVVYKVKNQNLYFLTEHQSVIDYSMPYRMLEYCCEIIRDVVDKKKVKTKGYELPKIVPIVLYTGNLKWKVPRFIENIAYNNLKDIGVSLKYIIIDVNRYSKEKLLNSNSLIGLAMQLDKSNTSQEIEETIKIMAKPQPYQIENIKRIAHYILDKRLEKEEAERIEKDLDKKLEEGEVKEAMITLAERMEKYNKTLFNEGIAQGIAEGINTIAKKMLTMGMKEKDIQEATGLTKEEIQKLKEAH